MQSPFAQSSPVAQLAPGPLPVLEDGMQNDADKVSYRGVLTYPTPQTNPGVALQSASREHGLREGSAQREIEPVVPSDAKLWQISRELLQGFTVAVAVHVSVHTPDAPP